MDQAQSVEQPKEINCKNCGAPIKYVEGESVLHCAYCGTATMLAGFDKIVKVESHFIVPPTATKSEVDANIRKWMSSGFWKAADLAEKAVFEKIEGVVLPFWVVKTKATTYWSGMNKRTKTVGSGDNKRTETYWEPTSGSFEETYNWTVYAREDEDEYWGLSALNPGSKAVEADWGGFFLGFGTGSKSSGKSDLLQNAQPFSLDAVADMKVINGQTTQERAEQRGQNDIIGLHRRQAESKVTRVTDCDTTVDIKGCSLVYLPVWQVKYKYKGKQYKMLANGHTGEVIAGQAPVGKWDKVVMLSIIMIVLAGIFALIAFLAKEPAWWIGTGASAGVVALYAAWTALFSK